MCSLCCVVCCLPSDVYALLFVGRCVVFVVSCLSSVIVCVVVCWVYVLLVLFVACGVLLLCVVACCWYVLSVCCSVLVVYWFGSVFVACCLDCVACCLQLDV